MNAVEKIAAVQRWFSYDPETGVVSWREKPNRNTPIGSEAGFKWISGKNTYRRIICEGSAIFAHTVAIILTYGRLPVGVIDHINGDSFDNRLSNLREVSHTDNLRNQRLNERNQSGHMGVDYHEASGKWRARIIADQTEHHLGTFDTKDAAITARKTAEIRFGFHKNHGRSA